MNYPKFWLLQSITLCYNSWFYVFWIPAMLGWVIHLLHMVSTRVTQWHSADGWEGLEDLRKIYSLAWCLSSAVWKIEVFWDCLSYSPRVAAHDFPSKVATEQISYRMAEGFKSIYPQRPRWKLWDILWLNSKSPRISLWSTFISQTSS